MAYASLKEFVDALERAGELRRVKVPVDVELEITEIADRSVKSGGPALLFEKPVGTGGEEYDVPVLINAYASDQRMKLALGVESMDAVADEVAELLEIKPPEGIIEKVKMLPKLARLASFLPRRWARLRVRKSWRPKTRTFFRFPPSSAGPRTRAAISPSGTFIPETRGLAEET